MTDSLVPATPRYSDLKGCNNNLLGRDIRTGTIRGGDGTLPGGDGIYGPGNVCIFWGFMVT
jgi:hypothetical protein